uniref:Uncharacterized protein n=1 Tax=Rhizophora mucronata TaxID=61149 RepID=A0A2P2NMH1_RHIMU
MGPPIQNGVNLLSHKGLLFKNETAKMQVKQTRSNDD